MENSQRAEEVWEGAYGVYKDWEPDGKNHFKEAAISFIAAALMQAEEFGRRRSVEDLIERVAKSSPPSWWLFIKTLKREANLYLSKIGLGAQLDTAGSCAMGIRGRAGKHDE